MTKSIRLIGILAAVLLLSAASGALTYLVMHGQKHPTVFFTNGASASKPISLSDYQLDPTFFYAGSVICSRDLVYIQQSDQRLLDNFKLNQAKRSRIENTISLIKGVLNSNPQVEQFQCSITSNQIGLSPFDWTAEVSISNRVTSDIVVIGAELPALTTAIDAADRGYSVTVVYSGPLGGICADSGANLRFFDFIPPTSHPSSQLKLFNDALRVGGLVAIPPNTDALLASYFGTNYSQKIRLVKTRSYDSLHVDVDGNRLADVTTDEGTQVSGQYFIDTDPESRVAEKSGIPMDLNTPDLSYGVCFDINGLSPADIDSLESHDEISPVQIMSDAGVTMEQVIADHRAYASYLLLEKYLAKDFFFRAVNFRLGYNALAQGFDFKMQCQGLSDPGNSELKWLNSHRTTSGFNISMYDGVCTFNAMSYYFPKTILQSSHDFTNDKEFAPIRDIDMPALNQYFQSVTGNSSLSIRLPSELYVRKSTAFFKLLHPYRSSEFNRPPRSRFYVTYPMDFRDLRERDPYSWKIVTRYINDARHKRFWDCRASATQTQITNLFLINKDAVTPAYCGGQRILGSQINFGAALVDSLPRSYELGSDPEYITVQGKTLENIRSDGGLNVAVNRYSLGNSGALVSIPWRTKTVEITWLTPKSEVPKIGEVVTVQGWDHGEGTALWATHLHTEHY